MKNKFRYLLAMPFMVLGIIFVVLWLLMKATTHLIIYAISFSGTLKHFVLFGEWKWGEIKDEYFCELD